MNREQEENLAYVIKESSVRINAKYRQGDREHGGAGLMAMPPRLLLDHAIDEAIDQVVYLLTLKRKLQGDVA